MCSFFHVLIPKTAPHFLAEGNNEVCVFRKFSFVSIFLRTKRLHLKKKNEEVLILQNTEENGRIQEALRIFLFREMSRKDSAKFKPV